MKPGFAALLTTVVLLASGCSDDLPDGWSDADSISVRQSTCFSTTLGLPPTLDATAQSGDVRLLYMNAPFRCDQRVAGYLRRNGTLLDVLFQPEDMEPSKVAGCRCLYTLDATFSADPGSVTITVYHRDDKYGRSESRPVQVGSVQLQIPRG